MTSQSVSNQILVMTSHNDKSELDKLGDNFPFHTE